MKLLEKISYLLGNVESSDSLSKLCLGVPSREIIDSSREEDSLTGTENGADCKELAIGLDGGGSSGDAAPEDDSNADVQSRTRELGDEKVARDLERQVSDEENRDGCRELLRRHVQVFHDALQFRCSQVLPVNVIENIQNADDGQDDKVHLSDKLLVQLVDLFLVEGSDAVWHPAVAGKIHLTRLDGADGLAEFDIARRRLLEIVLHGRGIGGYFLEVRR